MYAGQGDVLVLVLLMSSFLFPVLGNVLLDTPSSGSCASRQHTDTLIELLSITHNKLASVSAV